MAEQLQTGSAVQNIIAIAASAGGLEATSALAQNLPNKQNCCYVVAQHMSPYHKSLLVQLLSRETKLFVEELEELTEPQRDTIFIPPPGRDVVWDGTVFRLEKPAGHPSAPKPSADRLFKSLAIHLGQHAIGIVLSGTGSDGSYGVREIREAGGITIAQEPDSCKYDSMPVSAIRTGCVDLILTPQQIGQHLQKIVATTRDLSSLKDLNVDPSRSKDLLEILLAHTQVDFRQYKESTIHRRIERRMIAKGIDEYEQYVDLCRKSVDEVEALYRDLLISVTRFFRDIEDFLYLADLLRETYAEKPPKENVRIWVPGCATGEEAFTLAIIVCEALGGLDKIEPDDVQVFATDIDERALAVARKAKYPIAAISDIPRDYLEKYFDISEDVITAKQKLRNMILFTRHNVFQDAPFASTDLVSIRNVLIYFNSRLQERVLNRVLYSLKSDGLLMLGTSETTGRNDSGFIQLNTHNRIYKKRERKQTSRVDPNLTYTPERRHEAHGAQHSPLTAPDQWEKFDRLANAVVTNGLLVSRDRSILRVYGDIAPFCEFKTNSPGLMNISILKKQFASEAASLMLVALKYGERRAGQWHPFEGIDFNTLQMTAYPMATGSDEDEDIVLIGFATEQRTQPESGEKSDYINYIEDELSRTRDALQITVEQLQTSNEELQAVNEELQSSNEELQSTNEELETSNEELQSTNEELITVNEEMLVNSSQLQRTSAELIGLIENLPTKLLMLDQGLVIRYASKRAVRLFSLVERGQGYGHLSHAQLPRTFPDLLDVCSSVLASRTQASIQFEDAHETVKVTVSPLIAGKDDLIGLILLIERLGDDVTLQINRQLRQLGHIGTWQYSAASRTVSLSEEAYAILGLEPDPEGADIPFGRFMDCIALADRKNFQNAVQGSLEHQGNLALSVQIRRPDGEIAIIDVSATCIARDTTPSGVLVGILRDYSEYRTQELLVEHYNRISAELGIGFYSFDVKTNQPYWNETLFKIMGISPDVTPTIELGLNVFHGDARKRVEKHLEDAITNKQPYDYIEEFTRPDGSKARCHGTGNVALDEDGSVAQVYGSFRLVADN